MDDWSVSSPKNGVTEQGRRIGEYSALPADENRHSLSAQQDERTTLRRGYMAPRQYGLKKGHLENRLRNVRTMKLQIFIINLVILRPIAETVHIVEKYQARPPSYSMKYVSEEIW
jgi:hypothetical protein